MKKIFTGMLAICMLAVLLLGGCGTGQTEPTAAAPDSTAGASENSSEVAGNNSFSEKITITAAGPNFMDVDTQNNALWQAVTQKFNIDIKLVELSWDGWAEKVRTWMGSGDMPDVVQWDFNYVDYLNFAKSGLLKPVPSLDKFPNLKKLTDAMKIDDFLQIDGQLYAWPRRLIVNPYNNQDNNVYFYRKDWAAKAGVSDITDKGLLTMDEFLTVAKAFRDKDPGQFGAKNIVLDSSLMIPGMTGINWYSPYYDTFKKVDGKYVWGASLPETVEGIKYMKMLYDEGILYKDFYTSKGYDARGRFYSGLVGIYADPPNLGHYYEYRNEFKKANPDLDPNEAIGAFTVKNTNGKITTKEQSEFWSASLYSAKMSDKALERLHYMMDWLAGDEGSKYCFYGVKGMDWDEKDGKVELKWSKDSDGNMVAPDYGNGIWIRHFALAGGDQDWANMAISDIDRNLFKKLADFKAEKGEMVANNYPLEYLNTPLKSKFGSYSTGVDDEIIKIVSSSKDVEEDWNAWIKSMQSKIAPILDEINGQLADK